MNIIFQVKSDRINDIKIQPGTTVGALIQILKAAGYDVMESVVRVYNPCTNESYIGDVEPYVLNDLEGIQFKTAVVDLDNTANRLFAELRKNTVQPQQEPQEQPKPEACRCSRSCGCASNGMRKLEFYLDEDGSIVAKTVNADC